MMNTTHPQSAEKKHFWNWNNDGEGRELYLYGTIAEQSWYDDEVTPGMFREELMSGSGPVTVWLNSYGGDCIAASQIYTMLMEYPEEVTVKIDGIAASAASVIAMAGTTILMSPTSCLMIHDPSTLAYGNEKEMEKAIEMLQTVKETIITAYEIRTGLDRGTLADLMTAETWMDCHKAVELGFADGILSHHPPVNDYAGPTLFCRRSVDRELVNKLCASVPAEPLYERLEKLNPH